MDVDCKSPRSELRTPIVDISQAQASKGCMRTVSSEGTTLVVPQSLGDQFGLAAEVLSGLPFALVLGRALCRRWLFPMRHMRVLLSMGSLLFPMMLRVLHRLLLFFLLLRCFLNPRKLPQNLHSLFRRLPAPVQLDRKHFLHNMVELRPARHTQRFQFRAHHRQ